MTEFRDAFKGYLLQKFTRVKKTPRAENLQYVPYGTLTAALPISLSRPKRRTANLSLKV